MAAHPKCRIALLACDEHFCQKSVTSWRVVLASKQERAQGELLGSEVPPPSQRMLTAANNLLLVSPP